LFPHIAFAYLAVDRLAPIKLGDDPLVQRGQRPAPAGQLAGGRYVGDHVGFLRSLNRHHCWCRRRLPACPRALSAGSTLAQQARIVGPGLR
jgi:hypothetical protein